MVIVVDAF